MTIHAHIHAAGAAVLIQTVLYVLVTLYPLQGAAEIRRSRSSDGTLHFYGTGKNISRPFAGGKKRVFSSPYVPLINRISREAGMDPYLIQCIVMAESGFRADAVSKAGAMGLMQIMQEVAEYYEVTDPFDPGENLRAGILHFASLMRYFKNDAALAVAAYHAGLGTVRRHGSVPPIKSTIRYVERVLTLYGCPPSRSTSKSIRARIRRLYMKTRVDGTIDIYSR